MLFINFFLPRLSRFPFKLTGDYNLKNSYLKLEKLHYTLANAKPSEYERSSLKPHSFIFFSVTPCEKILACLSACVVTHLCMSVRHDVIVSLSLSLCLHVFFFAIQVPFYVDFRPGRASPMHQMLRNQGWKFFDFDAGMWRYRCVRQLSVALVHLSIFKTSGRIGRMRLGLAFLSMRKTSHQKRYAPSLGVGRVLRCDGWPDQCHYWRQRNILIRSLPVTPHPHPHALVVHRAHSLTGTPSPLVGQWLDSILHANMCIP